MWKERDGIIERLAAAADDAARVRVLDAWLQRRLAPERRDRVVEAAVRRIFHAGGREPVDALAARLGVTRQHLARRFAERVGVPPKMLARIARMQRLLEALRRSPEVERPAWSGLALDCGYYDQAHLAAEFRALVGCAPGAYLGERRALVASADLDG